MKGNRYYYNGEYHEVPGHAEVEQLTIAGKTGRVLVTILLGLLVIAILLFVVSSNQMIPKGYASKEEFRDPNGFQDYADYCKYYYKDKEQFVNNLKYKKLSESDIEAISGYFADYQSWMEAEGRLKEYDFDTNRITVGDYAYIETKEGSPIGQSYYGKYDNYTVCFFDTDSCTLYYIHLNI